MSHIPVSAVIISVGVVIIAFSMRFYRVIQDSRDCYTDEDIGTNKHEPVRVSAMLGVHDVALPATGEINIITA